eukprot:scaffold2822_cov100-Isochrysis_galbana.AAC.13
MSAPCLSRRSTAALRFHTTEMTSGVAPSEQMGRFALAPRRSSSSATVVCPRLQASPSAVRRTATTSPSRDAPASAIPKRVSAGIRPPHASALPLAGHRRPPDMSVPPEII